VAAAAVLVALVMQVAALALLAALA